MFALRCRHIKGSAKSGKIHPNSEESSRYSRLSSVVATNFEEMRKGYVLRNIIYLFKLEDGKGIACSCVLEWQHRRERGAVVDRHCVCHVVFMCADGAARR